MLRSINVILLLLLLLLLYVASIVKKVIAALKAMKNIRKFIASKRLLQIHKSLVEPYFDCCLTVLDPIGIALSTISYKSC
jgi:hypothetical protein